MLHKTLRRRSPAAAALIAVLSLAAVLAFPAGALALGSPDISATTSSSSVLFGSPTTVTVTASNPTGQPYGYNLAFRAVIPANVTYVAGSGSPAPTNVLTNQPAAGQTTLLWANVSDLSPNSSTAVSFQVNHSAVAFTIGNSFSITGEATINTDPRNTTQFNATTGVPVAASYTGSATSTGVQSITAIKVSKTGGGSLLRGVHDHQTTYTTTATNNLVNSTTGVVLTDYLPAGIEYLGCGGAGADHTTNAPTNPGSAEEYPGSGPIVVPVVAGCVAPSSVDTVTLDPDGAGPLPNAVYTRLQWSLGTLAAGQVVNRPYRVAVPLRANTDTWTGTRPTAASGNQATNLDNNAGAETDDEQALTSRADATGNYNGVTPVSDAATLTTIAEDLLTSKSPSSGSLVQGATTTWTITFLTGEYRYSEAVTVTETLPNAYCPLGPINYTTQNSLTDSQCDPTGAVPSVPYSSVTENSNGTYTIIWTPGSLPKLTHATVNDTWTITFPTKTRTNYQNNFNDAGPILANDKTSNNVATAGFGLPRCTAPGAPDCNPSGPRIDHDGLISRIADDAASAGQVAPNPNIDKQIAQSGTNCATATYTNTTPSYVPGDRVCWLLHVNFPGGVDTASQRVTDFLPPTATYEAGSETATPANTVSSTFDGSFGANGVLFWNLTGGDVPTGGLVFEHTFSSIVTPSGQLAPGQIPGNLMKFSSSDTPGVSFPLRDQVDFNLAIPVIGLTKGVRQVNSGTLNGANVDGVTVQGGDSVTYRVDVTNTGTADAVNTVVWDLLPTEYDCATLGQITLISDGGTCVDAPFPAQDRIQWSIPLAKAATKMLTYKVVVPTSVGPNRTLINHAGVRSFQTLSNLGTLFTYTPASNIDTANATPSNVPAADNFSNVITRNVTITKAATTPVDGAGNTAAQATIGENITYTVTTVIPQGATVPGNFRIADAVSARQVYQAGSVSATLNGSPLPVGWSTSEAASTPTVNGPAAGYTATGSDTTIVMTFIARVADLSTNTRLLTSITNTGSATWTDPVSGAQARTSTATSIQIVEPLITQTKTDSVNPARVIPDQIVTYTLTTTNSNATRVSIAHDTTVVDVVPAGLTPIDVAPGNLPLANGAVVPGTGGATWDSTARTITRAAFDLNPNTSVVMTYRVKVDNPAVAGNTLTNTATARTTSMAGAVVGERTSLSSPNVGYISAPSDTIRIGGATVVKTADRTTATIGDPVTYTAVVTIPANINLYDVTLRDTLPDALDYDGLVSATCTSGCPPNITVQTYTPTITAGLTNVAWDLGDLTAAPTDRTVTVVYRAHVRATHRNGGANVVNAQTIVNSARVSSDLTNTKTFNPAVIPTVFDDTSAITTATVTVIEPAITVNKKVSVSGGAYVDSALAQANDSFSYQILVTNTGTAPAYDVQVTDTPDAELTGVTLAAGISTTANTDPWTAGNPAMAWTIPGPIAPGATVTLTYTANLIAVSSLSDGQTIVNTAAIPHYFGVPALTRAANPTWVFRDYTNGGSDSVTVTLDFPTLTIAKTTGRPGNPETATVEWGQSFPWRVVVTNTSASAIAKTITVHDLLPPNWSYNAGSASFSAGGAIEPVITPHATGDDLDWATGQDLAPGASITLTFSATPSLQALLVSPGPGPNVNRADTTAKDEAGNSGNAGGPYAAGPDPATATMLAPVLSIAKTPDAGTATAGAPTSWAIAVTNTGSGVAHNLTVTDVLPAGTTYTPGAASIAPPGGFAETSVLTNTPGLGQTTITWTIASIAAGATKTITVPVATDPSLASGTTLTNTSSTSAQDAPTLRTDPGSRIVSTSADLEATKTGTASGIPGGPDLTYTIGVINHGPSVARNVTLSDPLPANATFVSATNGCTQSAGTVSCAVGDLAVAGTFSADVVISYPASATGSRTNTVTAASPTPDPGPSPNTASVTTTLDPSADMQIVKTASAGTINNGENVTYTLDVKNNGISDAANVSVSDPLPAGTSFVSADAPCTESAGTVTCPLGLMAAGASTTLHITVTATSIGTKVNTATVSTTTPDPNSTNDSDSASVTVDPTADLEATKVAPASADVGDTITYTIGATNNGPDDAANVTLSDVLPAGVQFVSADAPCTETGGTVTCAVGALADGDSVTRDIRVTVLLSAANSTVSNTSTTASPTNDPDPSNNDATDTTDVNPSADMQITKTASAASVNNGENFTYTLVVKNNGVNDAANVSVSDPLPAGTSFVSADAPCVESSGTVTCALGTMVPDDVTTLHVTVTATSIGTKDNTATVSTTTFDPNSLNDTSTASVTVDPTADLEATKVASPTANVGDTITYTIGATNNGPDDAASVTLSDVLPAGVQFVSADAPCTEAAGTVTCSVGGLPSGGSVTRDIQATVLASAAGTTVSNTSTTASSTNDPDNSNNDATDTTDVAQDADLQLAKSAAPAAILNGATTTFTLTATNNGPSAAVNASVSDPLPAGLEFVSADAGCAEASGTVTCDLGDMASGAAVTRHVVVKGITNGTWTNTGTVSSDTRDRDPSNDSASADVVVGPRSDLIITKQATANVPVGGVITWTILVTNQGPDDATNLTVSDPLPAGVVFVSADSPCTEASGTVTCPVGTLPAGDQTQLVIKATAPLALADKTLVNTATVTADQGDGDPVDNSASASTLVGPAADLQIAKTGPATAVAGGTITWQVVVTNKGPSIASNVTVSDTLPTGLTLVSATPDQGTCASAAAIVCNVGTLPIGASTQIAIVARTAATDVGRVVTNSASVTGDQPDPDPANNSATASATTLTQDVAGGGDGGATPTPDRTTLTIRKTASAKRVASGQRVIYWVTVKNTGAVDAVNVRICDQLPARLTYLKTPKARFIKGNACWTRAKLAHGKSTTVRFEARVVRDAPGGVRITNVALVTADNATGHRAQVSVTVRGGRTLARRLGGVTG